MSKSNSCDRANGYTYPRGHLGHLTADQSIALEEMKSLCQDAGIYTRATDGSKSSHGDETMLRFLRARDFVPIAALQQFKTTEEWRKEQDIEGWYSLIDVKEYEETRLLYTQWTGRRDRNGLPLYVFDISQLDAAKILRDDEIDSQNREQRSISRKLHRLFATYEHLMTFVMPLCSAIPSRPYPESPVSQTTNIVNISGMGLRQFWKLKSHLQDASALATAHYPETLGRTFIVGVPSFFPAVWNWIKPWYDPVTVSKILILGPSEVPATLAKYVEPSDIPKKYRGTLEWEFGDLPKLDPEISKVMSMITGTALIPKGPIRWRQSESDGRVRAHALGTQAGVRRDDIVAEISSDDVSKSLAALIH